MINKTYQLRQTITYNINLAHSFVSNVETNPPLYHEMNYWSCNLLVYNESWEYQKTFTLKNSFYPTYSINIYGTIYIAGDFGVRKYDMHLSFIKEIYCYSRGIYYNASNQLIYVVEYPTNIIQVFDQDLNLNDTIITNQSPWFLT